MTYPLLEKAPPHNAPEFIDFLRDNNPVVWENPQWIVIENCKYHTKEKPWYTAFWKGCPGDKGDKNLRGIVTCNVHHWYEDIDILWHEFGNYKWIKKAKRDQTIGRFHIHLTQ